jgi:predicted N-acetyltransferase YhbS
MPVEIRAVAAEEFAAWVAVMLAAEHDDADPVPEAAFRRPAVDLARTLGGFDGDRVVATFRSFPTRLTVPGGEIAADAITDVGVASSHRRRGLLTAMMRRDLAAAVERGEPVAILIASEAAIYGRYGFGCAADWGVWCLEPRRAEFPTALAAPAEVGLEPLSAATLATVGPAVSVLPLTTLSADVGTSRKWAASVREGNRECPSSVRVGSSHCRRCPGGGGAALIGPSRRPPTAVGQAGCARPTRGYVAVWTPTGPAVTGYPTSAAHGAAAGPGRSEPGSSS